MEYQGLKDKVPPHNLEAEQAVLGAMLLDWGSVSNVISMLQSDRFYSYQNQVIYEAIVSLFSQNARGDVLTLINELTKTNKLQEAGGAAYIAALSDTVPTSANIEYYAQIVLDMAIRRDLIKMSEEVKSTSFDKSRDSRLILEEAEKKIFSLTERNERVEVHEAAKLIGETLTLIEDRYNRKEAFTGIPCGIGKLDTMTSGFQNEELIILGARPSIGKTAMALSMMQYISVVKQIPCGFFSLEMSYRMIGQRLLSQESRVPGQKLRTGMLSMSDFQKLQDAAGRIFKAPLYIVDQPNMLLLDLRALARRLVVERGVKIIFIDYIGLIQIENRNAPVYEAQSEVSKSLKALARELGIPIVALCQVARDAEGNEPNLAQLRGSGSIEQDADVVMFLHRERLKGEEPAQEAKLIVAKQRNGATGDVQLTYLPSYTKFENASSEEE
ncbi:MAG: replicative DNA helicase [Treponema sp.]|nr:replicative DNA helicase [Treponema sp.]MEE3434666.1 replicative DNA helicase [Treponema sp.]